MLIPGLNQLAEPEIVKVEVFEPLLAEFKAEVLAYVEARDPQKAARLAESLDNDSELLTMALQAFTVRLQTHERKYNARIKQHLAWWAEGSNLDARLADMGLMRRVISEGDPSAFPPVPAVVESDDDARIRYYLAPHAPAAGSRLQYRREAMTLGERAKITIERNDVGQLVVTYNTGDGNIGQTEGQMDCQWVTNFVLQPGYYDGVPAQEKKGFDRYQALQDALVFCKGVVADDQAAMDILSIVGRRTWQNDDGNGCTVHSAVYNLDQKSVLWVPNENYTDASAKIRYSLQDGRFVRE